MNVGTQLAVGWFCPRWY